MSYLFNNILGNNMIYLWNFDRTIFFCFVCQRRKHTRSELVDNGIILFFYVLCTFATKSLIQTEFQYDMGKILKKSEIDKKNNK